METEDVTVGSDSEAFESVDDLDDDEDDAVEDIEVDGDTNEDF